MTPVEIVPTVHTEGGRFMLDIVDDAANPNEKNWRITLVNGVLQVALLDASGCDHRVIQIGRTGTTPEVSRGGELL